MITYKKNLVYFLLMLVILVFVFLNIRMISKKSIANKERDLLKQRIEELNRRKQEFSEQIMQADTEDYLEKVGREDFNLKKEGEKVVAFPMDNMQEQEQEQKDGFWSRLFKRLGLRD